MNELTFVARLATATRLRAERRDREGVASLIAAGEVEERQIDADGRVRRCDIRLNAASGRKLASGEVKRPEVPDGRDPRSEALRTDARRKAIARGLPFYFTCNMAEIALYSVSYDTSAPDAEEASYRLAPIDHSSDVEPYFGQIEDNWSRFLDDLEVRLTAAEEARPKATSGDVVLLRDAIYGVAQEALGRAEARLEADEALAGRVRAEAEATFGFQAALRPSYQADFREELLQILRFGVFVVAQKLVLYRVLEETGPRRSSQFHLDPLSVPEHSTDPNALRSILDAAFKQAMERSEDFETAFEPEPLANIVFLAPEGEEVEASRVGAVWSDLLAAVHRVSWVSISRNLIGFLYEVIVDPQYRHHLGQFYTRDDVVDLLVTCAVQASTDIVMDPAAGGGSFLRSAYERKRALGDTHKGALASIWGFEITAFAAELSTIALATSDTREAAAYPRVVLKDFFDVRPKGSTNLRIPSDEGDAKVPKTFDAVVGNPPYISYRRQTNKTKIAGALTRVSGKLDLPRFSGKSDVYVWFVVYATWFLREEGRLCLVLSSSLLYADYGVPLIQFLARHFRIRAVIQSKVERWFPDADTNTLLLLAERCSDEQMRAENEIRFIELRRRLDQLIPEAGAGGVARRQALENLVDEILAAPPGGDDPRMAVNVVPQGRHAGVVFVDMESDSEGEEDG